MVVVKVEAGLVAVGSVKEVEDSEVVGMVEVEWVVEVKVVVDWVVEGLMMVVEDSVVVVVMMAEVE